MTIHRPNLAMFNVYAVVILGVGISVVGVCFKYFNVSVDDLLIIDPSLFCDHHMVVLLTSFREFCKKNDRSFYENLGDFKESFYLEKFGAKDVFKGVSSYDYTGNRLELFGIDFTFENDRDRFVMVSRKYSVLEVLCCVNSLFRFLGSINKRGYVTEKCLSNCFVAFIMSHLEHFNFESKLLANSELPYTMWFNYLFISFYYLVIERIKVLKANGDADFSDDESLELLEDLECCKVDLLSRMDQYLKMQIQKRGITVIQNTYAGFDTEYVIKEGDLNELVSAQVAVYERTILKIPLYHAYNISYINPLSSEVSDIYVNKINSGDSYKYSFTPVEVIVQSDSDFIDKDGVSHRVTKDRKDKKVKVNEMFLLNQCLLYSVELVRTFLYGDLYEKNRVLIDYFKGLCNEIEFNPENEEVHCFKGAYCFDDFKRDQFVFAFPLSPLRTKISFPSGGNFGLNELFDLARDQNTLFDEDIDYDSTQKYLNYFRSISVPPLARIPFSILGTIRGGGVKKNVSSELAPLALNNFNNNYPTSLASLALNNYNKTTLTSFADSPDSLGNLSSKPFYSTAVLDNFTSIPEEILTNSDDTSPSENFEETFNPDNADQNYIDIELDENSETNIDVTTIETTTEVEVQPQTKEILEDVVEVEVVEEIEEVFEENNFYKPINHLTNFIFFLKLLHKFGIKFDKWKMFN